MQIIKTKQSPNFSSRNGFKVDVVVLHSTDGLMPGCLDWLCNPVSKVSAHYIVTRTGAIYQLVNELLAAWHAGESAHDVNGDQVVTADEVRLNRRSIGIELESADGTYTKKQLDALQLLLLDIMPRRRIHIENLVGHKEITPRKNDPVNFNMPQYRLKIYACLAIINQPSPGKPIVFDDPVQYGEQDRPQPDERPGWRKFIDRIINAFKKLFSKE